MERLISDQVNYVAEAIALLEHLGNGETFEQKRMELLRKADHISEKTEKQFSLLSKLEREAGEELKNELECINYYFKPCQGVEDYVGNLLLLHYDYEIRESGESMAEFADGLQSMPEEIFVEKFGAHLQGYGSKLNDCKDYKKAAAPMDIINLLMKMELPLEEKWKIQEAFLNRKEKQKELLQLVAKAETFLHRYDNEFLEQTRWFQNYWRDKLEDKGLSNFFTELGLGQISENPLGYHIYPSIIACKNVSFRTDFDDEGKYKEYDIATIGIFFDDDFSVRPQIETENERYKEYVCSVLKILSDKSKFEILMYIKDKKAYGSELAKHLNLTTATISHHMSALMSVGLLKMEKEEAKIYYSCNREVLAEVLDYCKEHF